jgi:hypothetical protein
VGLLVGLPMPGHADNALVLPKGRALADITYYHYFDIDERYNPDGKVENIAVDYNADLNSNIFPGLQALNQFVGGQASVGRSVVDFTLVYRWTEVTLSYGLLDRLTVGVLIPVNYSKNRVRARLDATTANVGKNAALNSVAPLRVPGTVPLTTEDVQDLLGAGLDINGDGRVEVPGFGFKRFESWSGFGVGDIELLARYQFVNTAFWRFAMTSGVRLPTGRVDDPDDLTDLPFGDGQTDLITRLHLDYVPVRPLLLNLTLRYDIQLPDKQEKRVLDNVNQPITANKEKVSRNLGDILEVEVLGSYDITKVLSAGAKYRFTTKVAQDSIDGDLGFNYGSLESETKTTSHMFFVLLGLSTVRLYQEKHFPVPLSFSVAYRNRFAGRDNVTRSEYISFSLTGYF